MWRSKPTTKLPGHVMSPAHASPSWADKQLAGGAPRASDRRESRYWWVGWAALTGLLVLGFLPFALLPYLPPIRDERERLALFFGIIVWIGLIVFAIGRIGKSLRPSGAGQPAGAVMTRFERALNYTALCLSLLTLYALVVNRRPIPLWLWGCCVATVVVLTMLTLWTLPGSQRRRVAPSVYGMVIGLCILFPVATLPRASRLLASELMTAVMIVMVVLLLKAGTRLRASPAGGEPRPSD
jgi:hypothetical protein